MLSTLLQVLYLGGFVAVAIMVWCLNNRPNWGFRSVVLGWFALSLWTVVWSFVLPKLFKDIMDAESVAVTFPDGMVVAPTVFAGWFYPLFVIMIRDGLRPKNPR